MPTTLLESWTELFDTIAPFELHEMNAVLFLARRLAMGREKYGPLNPHDGRDWSVERAEELADSFAYDYCAEAVR